ncbi:hypothetical protein [Saccharothrix lopnurensis]|uniref:LPXTG-motif cell wall-anchored protein n=1 Tax=Saccharothrix lopnurensis TaxID=1670621 RepID=A0ABW1P9I9_9PSEU
MPLGEQSLSAGEPWYVSGTFWTIAAVVVGVVAIAVTTWAAFRSARPRRILYIWADSAVPLVSNSPGLRGRSLAVSLDGRELAEPHTVTVRVAGRSALDIAASAFDGAPLELEFGVPIVALLEQRSDAGRAAVREPAVQVRGTALHVGPALLTRRHRLRYTVLLDGEPRFHPVSELPDVVVRREPAPDLATGTLPSVILLGIPVLIIVAGNVIPGETPGYYQVWSGVLLTLFMVLFGIWGVRRAVRRIDADKAGSKGTDR